MNGNTTKLTSLSLAFMMVLSIFAGSMAFVGTVAAVDESTADIVVDDDGTGDYETLQAALENATDGDTIYVKAGTYQAEDDSYGMMGLLAVGVVETPNVFVVGAQGAILDGTQAQSSTAPGDLGFGINASGVTVEGFEFTNLGMNDVYVGTGISATATNNTFSTGVSTDDADSSLDATDNYWGTTDTAEIESMISGSGTTTYDPYLTSDPTANSPPVADAGADQTVAPDETVTVDASGSTDSDGDNLTYAYSIDGGAYSPEMSDSTYTHSFGSVGTYSIDVRVTDEHGASDTDTMTVTVEESNSAPTADAGADRTVTVGDDVTFDGSGSTDADNDSLTYDWEFGDGENVSGEPTVTHAYSEAGTYEATLTVEDEHGVTDTNTVTVTVEENTTDASETTQNITVNVTGEDGESVSNATVTLDDLNESADSDVNGAVSFESVEEGEQNVTIEADGYKTLEDSISVTADDTEFEFTLTTEDASGGGGGSIGDSDAYYVIALIAALIVIVGAFAAIAGGNNSSRNRRRY